jgi:heterotetrameric sarcosine oxidase delta subunit
LLIACPFCGPREHGEFSYGGDATVRRPHQDELVWGPEWQAYVYERANPRGPHKEYWHHVMGCRQWLVVTRDTFSHEIIGCVPAEQAAGGGR